MADEEMLDDDLPEHQREKKPIDVANIDMSDPLTVVAETKKGQVVLVFVDIRGEPTEEERDQITVLWEGMMINAHNIEAKRFPIKNDRVIFQLARGEQVRELAQLLRQQERCSSFQVDNELYLAPGHPQWNPKRPHDSKSKMEAEKRWKGDDWRPKGWSERLEWSTSKEEERPKEKVKNVLKKK